MASACMTKRRARLTHDGSYPAVVRQALRPRLLPRRTWHMLVVLFLSLEVTRARMFQLDECPVGCSSHGSCRDGLCDCAAGWTGQDCSYYLADSTSSEEDPLDGEEECVDDCSAHGTCGGGLCRCQAGWSGLSCNIAAQCPESCRPPNGNCNAGTCVCMAGFFGPECGDALCPHSCFGHGSCNRGACVCSEGWFGRLCDSKLDEASMCDPPCANNGQCVGGQCFCIDGFTGIDCSQQAQVTAAEQAAIIASTRGMPKAELPPPTKQAPPASQQMKNDVAAHGEVAQLPLPQRGADHASRQGANSLMARRIHHLEDELSDVERQAQVLQGRHGENAAARRELADPAAAHRNVVLTQTAHRARIAPGLRPVQQFPIPNSLDAVRRATSAAGSAAERLHRTAEKEFEEAALHRADAAIKRAHQRANLIPGYQEIKSPRLSSPVTPTASSATFPPLQVDVPHAKHVPAAPDVDHEDSEELTDQTDDVRSLVDDFRNVGGQANAAKLNGVHSLMVSRSGSAGTALADPSAQGPVCEANCGGHGTCVKQGEAVACQCSHGWVGMLCDIARCPSDCNGRGLCLQDKCLCSKDWVGKTCGNFRCPDDCSGVGYCFAGKCRCKTGYTGYNCATVHPEGLSVSVKMRPLSLLKAPPPIKPYHEGMTLRAIPPKKCPDNCNGRGDCASNGECQCNVGYSGLACEMFCPNECSHNGDCIEGACLCFAGFLGVDCSITGCCSGHGTCDNPGTCVCEPGWDGDDCSLKLMCADPTCSGHGTCTKGECTCATGFNGPTCAIADGGCEPPCGPNGACNPISKRCECAGGSAGLTCLSTIVSCPNNCNGKGLCMNGECMCGPGWMGADCAVKYFAAGQKPAPAKAALGGAGAADAASGGLGGMPSIVGLGGMGAGGGPAAPGETADDGVGPAQEEQVEGPDGVMQLGPRQFVKKKKPPTKLILSKATGGVVCGEGGFCSGHGVCNTELARCDCKDLFYGDVCEMMHCPGFVQSGTDCFGHGMCEMGKCSCAPGWGMAPFRMIGPPKPQSCMDKICPVGCGMHGKCVNGVCVCQQGWQGPNCKDPQCPNDCAGHGQCAFQSPHSPGQCICNYGWGGAGCQRIALYSQLQKCPNDCSGNGLCMNGMCSCNIGFSGPDCTEVICTGMMAGPKCDQQRCPNDCNGRGLCMNGICACWSYYDGNDCKIPVSCMSTCGGVCQTPGREDRCESCIGMCESSAPRSSSKLGGPPLGMHNPFEDLQSTFLQKNATPVKPNHIHATPAIAKRSPRQHKNNLTASTGHRFREASAIPKRSPHKHRKNRTASTRHRHQEAFVATVQYPHTAARRHLEVSATQIAAAAPRF